MSLERLLPDLSVSRETLYALDQFRERLLRWTRQINLIAPATTAEAWQRHIVDSAQLFPLAPESAQTWCDLGTGGGLPGLVIAIIARERAPLRQHMLVESDRRKAAFLVQTARELGLNCNVVPARAEGAAPACADVVSARALAPLPDLLPMVARHLAPGGCALLPKGRAWATEVDAANRLWDFALEDFPSATDPLARILRLTELKARQPTA
jgi:16S rRNA (guanine527-N7)-methyltransferase